MIGRQVRFSTLTISPTTTKMDAPTIVSPRYVPAFATSVRSAVRWSANQRATSSSIGSMDDSSGCVSSQPQPTTSAQMTSQASTARTATCFQPGPSWPEASRRSVVVVGEDMAASLGVAPRGPPHPRGRRFPRFVCGLLPLSPLSDADESVCRRPRSAVRRPGRPARTPWPARRRGTRRAAGPRRGWCRARGSATGRRTPCRPRSRRRCRPARAHRRRPRWPGAAGAPAVSRWPSRPSSCWVKYACRPSLNSEKPGARADVRAERDPDAERQVRAEREHPAAEGRVAGRAVRDRRAAAAEHPQLALGGVHVVREHRPRAEQPVLVVARRVVAAEQLAHAADLLGVLVEVRGEERAGYVAQQGPGRRQERVGAGEREARGDGVPGAAAAVPPVRERQPLGVRAVGVGEQVLAQDPVAESTRPLVTRSPTRSASVNSASTAAAKCDPKTSAVVVPARARPSTKSAATPAAYVVSARRASSGSAQRSSQSSSGMPRPPIARTCGKCTWVSTNPGSTSPSRRSTTSSSGCSRRSTSAGPRAAITPSRTSSAASASARRWWPLKGLCGVSMKVPRKSVTGHRGGLALERREQLGRHRDRDGGGLLAGGDAGQADGRADPVDDVRRVPVGEQPGPEPRPLRRRADQPDRPEVVEPDGGVDEGDVLGVVVGHHQHVRARRQLGEHQLGQHRHRVDVHGGDGVGQRAERLGVQVLGAGVDQVQVEVVAGQDAGQLEADVADAEDRHARHHGQRLEQHGDLAAAALHAVLDRRLVRQVARRTTRAGAAALEQRPRTAYGLGLEVAAADRAPRRRAETTILAPASRGAWPRTSVTVTSTPASRRAARSVGTACHHVVISHAPDRPDRTAVERPVDRLRRRGEASSTETPGGPNAAHASRSASRTLKASINGGSPTALEP